MNDRVPGRRRARVVALLMPPLGLACIAAFFFLVATRTYTLSPEPGRYFHVHAGATLRGVADSLRREGIIEQPLLFMAWIRLRGAEGGLRTGTYRFEGPVSIRSIARDLVEGRVARRRITIPEGLNLDEVARHLSGPLSRDAAEIRALADDPGRIARLGLDVPDLEGFLFPDTYLVPVDVTPGQILDLMVRRFRAVFYDSLAARAEALGFTPPEAVTLASIIEKETSLESERPIISGVFHNRLRRGIPLEADPTVRYALGKFSGRILYRDLEVESPYNTYRNRGLPPGPICSPGRASLLAALYPADVDYLYFVAAGDGSHIFSRTLAEHNRARRRVRR